MDVFRHFLERNWLTETHPQNIDYCVDVLQEHANGGYLPPWFIPAPSKRFPLPEGEELPQQWDMPSISVPERRENALGRVENGEGMVGSIYSLDNAVSRFAMAVKLEMLT